MRGFIRGTEEETHIFRNPLTSITHKVSSISPCTLPVTAAA